MPGLHFGEAGVALAISEAIAAGYITPDACMMSFIKHSLCGRLDWPDITHGAAGQGVAVLASAACLKDSSLYSLAQRCAEYLYESQLSDGSWRMPEGVDGMSGEVLTGFAHGVSGILYFLCEYGHIFPSTRNTAAVNAGAQWLIKQSIEDEGSRCLKWRYSDSNPIHWKWWCHGSPGIALTFLKLYQRTSEPEYAHLARRALSCHHPDLRYPCPNRQFMRPA
jgi:lantibiotic modifying enzyme